MDDIDKLNYMLTIKNINKLIGKILPARTGSYVVSDIEFDEEHYLFSIKEVVPLSTTILKIGLSRERLDGMELSPHADGYYYLMYSGTPSMEQIVWEKDIQTLDSMRLELRGFLAGRGY